MARRLNLKRVLRGETLRALEDVAALVPEGLCVEDARGRVLYGERREGIRCEVCHEGVCYGAVIGGDGAARIARLIEHFISREVEMRALASETLSRYEELTLVYETSEKFSRVLGVDQVARLIVEEAHRFLQASCAALLLLDHRRDALDVVASVGDARDALSHEEGSLTHRVLASGRAEFVETRGDASMMCAPLRSGAAVFGLLHVSTDQPARWTAGDLKLVTSLASNAAAAISHAMLHRERLRQQALRSQIERFISPLLIDCVRSPGTCAVLFCDLGVVSPERISEEVLGDLDRVTSLALHVLMQREATVNLMRGQMIVALFPHEDSFEACALAACDAARELVEVLDAQRGGELEDAPGVGVARVESGGPGDEQTFLSGVGAAATLQALADGRILVDSHVADAVTSSLTPTFFDTFELPAGEARAFEVSV